MKSRNFSLKVKTFSLGAAALLLAGAAGGNAKAQVQVLPNGNGGYNVYGNPNTQQILPNGNGGFNTYGQAPSQILPNGNGGYNIYGGPAVERGEDDYGDPRPEPGLIGGDDGGDD